MSSTDFLIDAMVVLVALPSGASGVSTRLRIRNFFDATLFNPKHTICTFYSPIRNHRKKEKMYIVHWVHAAMLVLIKENLYSFWASPGDGSWGPFPPWESYNRWFFISLQMWPALFPMLLSFTSFLLLSAHWGSRRGSVAVRNCTVSVKTFLYGVFQLIASIMGRLSVFSVET